MSAANPFALTATAPDTHALSGALTFATAAQALRECRGAGHAKTLDLAGVDAADSAGLAVLLALARDARAAGRPFAIANAPESLRALAQLAEVDGLLGLG
ncbi:STAS domain-containing protein [Tahibacter soli]|uniref:STAS domain-containing protein n=1 Tax=Tahibacter soli TaxID=2983605 RepID=A0A9X4BI11_9GAMM|nr:STAS domain-containing protein [Tahibacter soli]MDC8014760.1 STAS domain-containing protein [Tahibacter soli]